MNQTRLESDSIGEIAVPTHAYWGAQTQRSILNFPFGSPERMLIDIVNPPDLATQAAARVNRLHGLPPDKAHPPYPAASEQSSAHPHSPFPHIICPTPTPPQP